MKKPLEELEYLVCLEPQVDHRKDNHRINFNNKNDHNSINSNNNNDNTSINFKNNNDNNSINRNNNINLGHSSSCPLILAKKVFVKYVLKREFLSRLNKIRSTEKVEQELFDQKFGSLSVSLSSSVLSENESICVKRRKKNPFLLSFETKERQKFRIKMSQKVNS